MQCRGSAICCELKLVCVTLNTLSYVAREYDHPWHQPLADFLKLLYGQLLEVAENKAGGQCRTDSLWQLLLHGVFDRNQDAVVSAESKVQVRCMHVRGRGYHEVLKSLELEHILQSELLMSHWESLDLTLARRIIIRTRKQPKTNTHATWRHCSHATAMNCGLLVLQHRRIVFLQIPLNKSRILCKANRYWAMINKMWVNYHIWHWIKAEWQAQSIHSSWSVIQETYMYLCSSAKASKMRLIRS